MFITADILSGMAGGIVGWIITRAFVQNQSHSNKALLITAAVLIWVAFSDGGGTRVIEVAMVERLEELFNSEYFALGALIGAVLATGDNHRRTIRCEPPRWD